MKPTRRDLLTSMTAMALLPACGRKGTGRTDTGDTGEEEDTGVPLEPAPEREVEPPAWDAPGTLDTAAFAWGVQTGDPTPTTVQVSVWTTESEVDLQLMRAEGDGWVEAEAQPGLTPVDEILQLSLDGLDPDTAYSLVFFTPSGERRSRVARFRTALDADGWRVLTIGATSCLGSGGRPWPSMSLVAQDDPDVFLLLGDLVYASGSTTVEDFKVDWGEALAVDGLQDACAHSAVVATWDDHEVANNFEGENIDPDLLDAARSAFRDAIPQLTGPGGTGVWRRLSWGSVMDLFVLDSRGERDGATKYMSTAQMDWLKQGLSESTARFKLIANSVPITDYYPMLLDALSEDRWQGYPEQRTEILQHIEDEDIVGVLWITGDFHFATISRVGAAGELGENSWEVMVGPAGSVLNPIGEIYENPVQFPVLFTEWNSTLLRLDPGLGEVVVVYIGDDGSVLAEKTLTI
jgi:phosphodiesterase/alkaline phosphatase D-like protein